MKSGVIMRGRSDFENGSDGGDEVLVAFRTREVFEENGFEARQSNSSIEVVGQSTIHHSL